MCHKVQGTQHFITLTQTLDSKKMIGTPFFGGHVVRWTPYFRGTSRTLLFTYLSYRELGPIISSVWFQHPSIESTQVRHAHSVQSLHCVHQCQPNLDSLSMCLILVRATLHLIQHDPEKDLCMLIYINGIVLDIHGTRDCHTGQGQKLPK